MVHANANNELRPGTIAPEAQSTHRYSHIGGGGAQKRLVEALLFNGVLTSKRESVLADAHVDLESTGTPSGSNAAE
jgi:hypothetical protein